MKKPLWEVTYNSCYENAPIYCASKQAAHWIEAELICNGYKPEDIFIKETTGTIG